jgi:hypothetical protein
MRAPQPLPMPRLSNVAQASTVYPVRLRAPTVRAGPGATTLLGRPSATATAPLGMHAPWGPRTPWQLCVARGSSACQAHRCALPAPRVAGATTPLGQALASASAQRGTLAPLGRSTPLRLHVLLVGSVLTARPPVPLALLVPWATPLAGRHQNAAARAPRDTTAQVQPVVLCCDDGACVAAGRGLHDSHCAACLLLT